MIDLILTMIVALDDVGGLFLNFTQKDINNLIKDYGVLDRKPKCNERGMIILWKKKYITNEQFAEYMDLDYDNGSFWIVADDFDDVLSGKYEYEIKVLDRDSLDWWEPNYFSNYTADDISYYWRKYDEDTLKAIIEFCIEKKLEIDDELMTEENTILKDGDIYFNDTKLIDYLDENDLNELRSELSLSLSEAQDAADQDEVYTKIINSFKRNIGQFKYKTFKDKRPGRTEEVEKLLIEISISDINDIEDWLEEQYNDYDFIDEDYGNILIILKERDYFEFDTPDYNYIHGDIDYDLLNDYTQDRLS